MRQMGIDEIHLGKKQKFLTVVSNLETGEPLWFGRERKNLDYAQNGPAERLSRPVGALVIE